MPTFASYSPWQDAGNNLFKPAGDSLNRLALEIAKARYNRNNRAAMMGLQLEKLQQQELLNQAHERTYQEQAHLDASRADHQGAVDDAATQLQKAVVSNEYPDPMANGPTIADQGRMLSARLHGAMALSAGLHGTPQNAFPLHNISANQVAIDPSTGSEVGRGPIELAPGAMYQQPGEDPVVNQRPFFAPAGSTPMDSQGQPEGPQTGFKPPGAANSRSSAVDAALVRGLADGSIDAPSNVTNKLTGAVTSTPASPLYIAATNALARNQSSPAQAQPQTQRPSHTPQEEDLIKQANDAISKGADPAKVKARLRSMGYNPN